MLPFIAGAIVGIGAVVAVNNKKKIQEKIVKGVEKVKTTATSTKDTLKEKIHVATSSEKETTPTEIEKENTNVK